MSGGKRFYDHSRIGNRQHQFGRLASAHADRDAVLLGLRSRIDNFCFQQILGCDQRTFRRTLGDCDRLAKFCSGLQIVDTTADDARFGHDRTVLAACPNVTESIRASVVELHRTTGCTG